MVFRVCVVGCGRIATTYHGPALAAYAAREPAIELTACCDARESSAEGFARSFGFRHAETDLDALIERHRPEAICLYVPEALTCPLACRILERRIPLLMEKPPGIDPQELERIIAASERSGTIAQVAFNRRAMPLVRRLKAILAAPGQPRPQHLACEFIRHGRTDPDFATTAIHGLDTVLHLAGQPLASAHFQYQELPQLGATVANIHVTGRFSDGATMQASFCPVAGATVERISVHAAGHSLFLQLPLWDSCDSPGRLRHEQAGRTILDLAGDALPGAADPVEAWGFGHENHAFLDEVRRGAPPSADVRSARQALALAEAIRRRQGEWRAA